MLLVKNWFSSEPRAEPAVATAYPSPTPTEPAATTLLTLGRKLQRNTLLATMTTDTDFELRFDVTPCTTLKERSSILSFESPGSTRISRPTTLLEFAFLPHSTTLQCVVGRPQDANVEFNTTTLPLGQTSRVEAWLKGNTFTLSVDGIQVCSSTRLTSKFPGMAGVRVWASSKQLAAAAASISNVVYTPRGGTAGAVRPGVAPVPGVSRAQETREDTALPRPEQALAKLAARAQSSDAEADVCLKGVLDQGGTLDRAGLAQFKEQFLRHKKDKHMCLAMSERLADSR